MANKSVYRFVHLAGVFAGWWVLAGSVAWADLVENVTDEVGGAEWIWSPAHQQNEIPVGDCYFRKSFDLETVEAGEVQIAADNQFELFVNGQPVGQGTDWRKLQVFDVTKLLTPGRNCVAIRVRNTDDGAAGLVGRVLVKASGDTYSDHPTNDSWKTSVRQYADWTHTRFNDQEWVHAASYGILGNALPWGNEVVVAGLGARFRIPAGFTIERLMRDDEVGSLIAMAFDATGSILASREGGNLLLLSDSDDNGTPDTVNVFCDQLTNVQGILPLGTRVFAVGNGPQGVALYRLQDTNRDGVADDIRVLVPMRGSRGEHGAHAVRLGPDGMLYVILGDHARVGKQPAAGSPYRNIYEGDLVQPRYEDPRGHAAGIPAPGGTIFRTDTEGSFVELVAGGLRNSYDFAFSPRGELFTYDADMEWDMGSPWYRPTRINHVTAGAEMGWRSGWAKWPDYYVDSLPAAINMGAGSPTGVEFYDHHVFPTQYHGAMFGCDWATGCIHCVRLQRKGATYVGHKEVFVVGRPLNATDTAVGPDGALYFCTGGRGTDGGVYRVRWTGQPGKTLANEATGVELALQQPQLDADWARARIATAKVQSGVGWQEDLQRLAADRGRSVDERLRALELLVVFGPLPGDQLLLTITQDPDAEMRAAAARYLFASSDPASAERLVELLSDRDALVRRVACESLTRWGGALPVPKLIELLSDEDRFVAFAARRGLETVPLEQWAHKVLHVGSVDAFARGSVALLAASRDPQAARAVIERCQSHLEQHQALSSQQLVNVLRVAQLALSLGQLSPEACPQLGELALSVYPSRHTPADRELVRLLVYLQVPGAADRFAQQLDSELNTVDKLQIAAYASRLDAGWTIDSKLALMRFLEQARSIRGGYSVSAYVENFARDFFTKFNLSERQQVLAVGERWPSASLSVLAKLPAEPPAELLAELRQLDQRIEPQCASDDAFRRLRVGIVAVLGRSNEPASNEYLRTLYSNSPVDRHTVAMSMTQHPGGENWPYLVDALKTVEGRVAQEVLRSLARANQRPQEAEAYRQVILQGLRLGDEGAPLALALLDHWAGRQPAREYPQWQQQLEAWQQWYAANFPTAPPAQLPADVPTDKWSYEELLAYLQEADADPIDLEQGRAAFEQAQCVKCHRCGDYGETIGPDLTNVSRRFQTKEILESIVYPSHNISDQYASQIVIADGLSYTGLVVQRGDQSVTVLLNDGEKVDLSRADIESIQPAAASTMPTGLLNQLTLEQVRHLFDFLDQEGQARMARRPVSPHR